MTESTILRGQLPPPMEVNPIMTRYPSIRRSPPGSRTTTSNIHPDGPRRRTGLDEDDLVGGARLGRAGSGNASEVGVDDDPNSKGSHNQNNNSTPTTTPSSSRNSTPTTSPTLRRLRRLRNPAGYHHAGGWFHLPVFPILIPFNGGGSKNSQGSSSLYRSFCIGACLTAIVLLGQMHRQLTHGQYTSADPALDHPFIFLKSPNERLAAAVTFANGGRRGTRGTARLGSTDKDTQLLSLNALVLDNENEQAPPPLVEEETDERLSVLDEDPLQADSNGEDYVDENNEEESDEEEGQEQQQQEQLNEDEEQAHIPDVMEEENDNNEQSEEELSLLSPPLELHLDEEEEEQARIPDVVEEQNYNNEQSEEEEELSLLSPPLELHLDEVQAHIPDVMEEDSEEGERLDGNRDEEGHDEIPLLPPTELQEHRPVVNIPNAVQEDKKVDETRVGNIISLDRNNVPLVSEKKIDDSPARPRLAHSPATTKAGVATTTLAVVAKGALKLSMNSPKMNSRKPMMAMAMMMNGPAPKMNTINRIVKNENDKKKVSSNNAIKKIITDNIISNTVIKAKSNPGNSIKVQDTGDKMNDSGGDSDAKDNSIQNHIKVGPHGVKAQAIVKNDTSSNRDAMHPGIQSNIRTAPKNVTTKTNKKESNSVNKVLKNKSGTKENDTKGILKSVVKGVVAKKDNHDHNDSDRANHVKTATKKVITKKKDDNNIAAKNARNPISGESDTKDSVENVNTGSMNVIAKKKNNDKSNSNIKVNIQHNSKKSNAKVPPMKPLAMKVIQ